MSSGRKRIVGFANFNPPAPPEPKEEKTKDGYDRMVLSKLLGGMKPYEPGDKDAPLEFMTSKEIQEKVSGMAIVSISTITEFMISEGFRMIAVEGGSLAWAMQADNPL